MARTKLQQIADGMRHSVQAAQLSKAWTSHTLPNGLELIYSRDQDQYRLALRSCATLPAPEDIDTIADVFQVPAETPPNTYTRKLPHPESGRVVKYEVLELVWREVG